MVAGLRVTRPPGSTPFKDTASKESGLIAKGSGRAGRGRGGKGGGIGRQALAISNAQISSAEQPLLQQIHAERAANLARAQQQMGFAKAAAAILQGIAPRVQDTYTNAANADAGYARGLGDNAQAQIDQQVG